MLQRSARSRAVGFDTRFTPRTPRRHANESFRSNAVETANRETRRMGSLCNICPHQPTVSQLLLRFRFYTIYGTWYISIRSIQYDGISYSNDSPHRRNSFESRKVLCTSFKGATLGRPPLLSVLFYAMDVPPAWSQACICGRTFSVPQAYTCHASSCPTMKK